MLNSQQSLPLWVLLIGTAATKAAFYMSMPFLAVFLVKNTHMSPWLIGFIVGLAPLANLLGGFLGGQLSDMFGRMHLLYGSIFLEAATFFSFYLAANFTAGTTLIICLGLLNFLSGFLSAAYQTVSQALIGDMLTSEMRAKYFQLRYAAINIGAGIGPVIGAFMGIVSSGIAFAVTGIIYTVYGIIQLATLWKKVIPQVLQGNQPKITFKDSLWVVLLDKKLRYFIISGILFYTCYAQLESTLSQYLVHLYHNGVIIFSLLTAINASTFIIFQYPAYLIINALSITRSFVVGTLIFAIGLFVFVFIQYNVWLTYIGMMIIAVGEIFVFPVSSIFVDNIAPEHLRGTYFGASNFRMFGLSIGPLIGGWILSISNGVILFLTMTLLALVSLIFNWLGERTPQPDISQLIKPELSK